MTYKVESLTNFLKETISGWKDVECITSDPRSEAFAFDPYFALVIDVYHKGPIPAIESRRASFGDPGAFETAASGTKDRFFLEEIPIRVEYKDVRSMEMLVHEPIQHLRLLKNSGTYPFYRLEQNRVIFDASGWVDRMRSALTTFPEAAWQALYESFASKMEHYLSDMGAASFSDDKYFLLLSESGFLRYAAASILMINRKFEPSHRDIEEALRASGRLPEGFWASWNTLLQKEREVPAQKRFEIARLLAGAIFSLGQGK